MISSAYHHHRPACSQQHAARLSRASIATCHLRRRIVLRISCRPILGTAIILTRLNYLNDAVIIPEPHPSPAPGAPRPNLRHTRLPGGFRCGRAGRGQHAIANIVHRHISVAGCIVRPYSDVCPTVWTNTLIGTLPFRCTTRHSCSR